MMKKFQRSWILSEQRYELSPQDLLHKWFLSWPADFHIGRNKISSNYIMQYNSDILVIVPITELNTAIITNNGAATMITNTDY